MRGGTPALVLYSFAIGCMAIPSIAVLAHLQIPCPIGDGCAMAARLPNASWWGIPIGIAGIVATLVVLSLAAWPVASQKEIRTLSPWGGAAVAGYAVYQQYQTFALAKVSCIWCVGATLALVGGAFALMIPSASRSARLVTAPLALALPFLIAAISSPPIPSSAVLDVGSVHKREITGLEDSSGRSLTVFASPLCPTCQREIPKLMERCAVERTRFIFRFMPLRETPEEAQLASLLHIAIGRNDRSAVATLLADVEPSVRLLAAQRALAPVPRERLDAMRAVQRDATAGKLLRLTFVPVVIRCSDDAPCRMLSGGES